MSDNVIITITGRKKLARAWAGDASLPRIVGMAFGDGGVDRDGAVITPTKGQTTLNHELLRKAIGSHSYPEEATCRYSATLAEGDLMGAMISEQGLYDADGDIVIIKNFSVKGKDSDMEMTFELDNVF